MKALAGHELASSPHLNRIAQQSPQTVVMLVNLLGNFSGYFHLRKAATAATVTQPNTEPFTTSARCVSLDIGTPLLHEGAFYSLNRRAIRPMLPFRDVFERKVPNYPYLFSVHDLRKRDMKAP